MCVTPVLPGKYIPAVSYTIHTRNLGAKQRINLKGKNEITTPVPSYCKGRQWTCIFFFLTSLMHYLPVDFGILRQKCGLPSLQSFIMKI